MSSVQAPRSVTSENAPGAIGPYSQGVVAGNLLFISGQLPVDPATGAFAAGGIAEHAHQCLKNLMAIAQAAGTTLERAVKVTVFLSDMGNFATVNQVYGEYFRATPAGALGGAGGRPPEERGYRNRGDRQPLNI